LGTIVVIGAVPVVLALLAGGVTHRLLPTFALLAGLSPVFGVVVLALVYMGPFGTTVIAGYIGADSDALVDWALMVTLLFVGALFGAAALVPQLVRRSRPQPVLLGAAPVLE
jgi:hypothetical protein